MCGGGGGGGGGGGAPKENPAVSVASAPVVRSGSDAVRSRSEGVGTAASQRMAQRKGGSGYRVALDVGVVNVGGSGATGLNIPKSG